MPTSRYAKNESRWTDPPVLAGQIVARFPVPERLSYQRAFPQAFTETLERLDARRARKQPRTVRITVPEAG